jgi:hypothetical protein
MDLEAAYILGRRCVRWPPEERSKALYEPDIAALQLGAQATHGHVFEHALPQRADGL